MTASALIWAKEINFPNGHIAPVFKVSPQADPTALVEKLPLGHCKALIMLSGGAGHLEETFQPRLKCLFEQVIAPLAAKLCAGFISGGTRPGVMTILGEAIAKHGAHSPMIGIAPAGPVIYPAKPSYEHPQQQPMAELEPNHSHFILVDSRHWGGEVDIMYGVAAQLKQQIPVLTLLVNGGELSKSEVLHSVRLQIPVIIIAGSGRLADELADLVTTAQTATVNNVTDSALQEIVRDGNLSIFPICGNKRQLIRLLRQHLGKPVGIFARLQAWFGGCMTTAHYKARSL